LFALRAAPAGTAIAIRPRSNGLLDEEDGGDAPEILRRRGLFNRAEEAIRLARYDDLVDLNADQDMLRAVGSVALGACS
jgi:hypothetical protein